MAIGHNFAMAMLVKEQTKTKITIPTDSPMQEI